MNTESALYFKCSVNICDQGVTILSSDSRFDPSFEGESDKDFNKFDIPGWSVNYDCDPNNPTIIYRPNSKVDSCL